MTLAADPVTPAADPVTPAADPLEQARFATHVSAALLYRNRNRGVQQIRSSTEPPPPIDDDDEWQLRLHNDDIHTFEEVTRVLMSSGINRQLAFALTMRIDKEGSVVIRRWPLRDCYMTRRAPSSSAGGTCVTEASPRRDRRDRQGLRAQRHRKSACASMAPFRTVFLPPCGHAALYLTSHAALYPTPCHRVVSDLASHLISTCHHLIISSPHLHASRHPAVAALTTSSRRGPSCASKASSSPSPAAGGRYVTVT